MRESDEAKRARLAEALRENLKRRKAQQRQADSGGTEESSKELNRDDPALE